MERSPSKVSLWIAEFTVNATSEAVSGSPSVNATSSRSSKVQVSPSSEQL